MRLALVKPDLASAVEDTLIRAGTTGQLQSVVSDEQLKKMLEQFAGDDSSATSGVVAKKKVIVQRKKTCESDDDDDDSDLL